MYLNRVFTRIFSYFKETLIYGYEYVFSKFIFYETTHTHTHKRLQLHTYKLSVKIYVRIIFIDTRCMMYTFFSGPQGFPYLRSFSINALKIPSDPSFNASFTTFCVELTTCFAPVFTPSATVSAVNTTAAPVVTLRSSTFLLLI